MKLYIVIKALTQDDHIPCLITDSEERAKKMAKERFVYYETFELNVEKEVGW